MASQLFADLYGCDEKILNSEEDICKIARQVVSDIGAEIVEECVHTFEPIGITYFAVITTSLSEDLTKTSSFAVISTSPSE